MEKREAWQNLGAIMESKATVASFCLELSKKLDMQFQSPPLPVELAMVSRGSGGAPAVESMASPTWQDGDVGFEQLASLYAKNK